MNNLGEPTKNLKGVPSTVLVMHACCIRGNPKPRRSPQYEQYRLGQHQHEVEYAKNHDFTWLLARFLQRSEYLEQTVSGEVVDDAGQRVPSNRVVVEEGREALSNRVVVDDGQEVVSNPVVVDDGQEVASNRVVDDEGRSGNCAQPSGSE